MSRTARQPGPANDRGQTGASASETPSKTQPEGRYRFEICRERSGNIPTEPFRAESWVWRLIAPTGTTVIESSGYGDEESCRAAVTILQEEAGTADVTFKV